MTESRLLIENFYFKQLLNEEVAFNEQYSSLLGDRTQEFFEYYCDGLNAQKQLILELQSEEITNQILKEKFGDQFAAKVAGFGKGALNAVGNLAGAGGFGSIGKAIQKKLGGSVKGTYQSTYLDSRNKNFTRSLGDYLGQLKTFDTTIPDKIGMVDVKKSGILAGTLEKGKQIAGGLALTTLSGINIPLYGLTGAVVAALGGLEKFNSTLNSLFDAQWKKIQNTQPVQDFDRVFEEKKKALRDKLSKLDKDGKETSYILKTVDGLGEYAKQNPGKSGVIIALMTFAIGLGVGPLGIGALTAASVPMLTGAVAFILRTGLGLLKGESASTAVGGALKAFVVGYLSGKAISLVGDTVTQMVQMGQPPLISDELIGKVNSLKGETVYVEQIRFMSRAEFGPGGFNYDTFRNFNKGSYIAFTDSQYSTFKQLMNNYNTISNAESAKKLFSFMSQVSNSQTTADYIKGQELFNAAMKAGKSAQEAITAYNVGVAQAVQGVTQAVGAGAGAAVGSAASVGASGKPPVIKESTKLSDILKKILTEAEAAAPGAVPPVLPGAAPVNPDKLSGNQQDAVVNLKKNIGKEITTYIKDVAKTFKVKGNSTSELLAGLRKVPEAKSAVDIIDSLIADFPKFKLEFPKDVTMDDKEAATPASTIEPAKPADTVKDATDAANKQGAKPADVVASIPDASPDIKKAATDAANTPGATASSVVYAINTFAGKKPMGTTDPSVGGSFTLSSTLAKQLSDVKQNPLVSGTLMPRLQKMMKLDASNPVNIKYVKSLVNTIKNAVMSPANKAALQKQLGGNIAALRKGMLAEDITSGDIAAIMKEINTLIPLLVNITFGLRQSTSKKNTSGTPPSPVKAPPGAVPPVLTGDTPVTEAAEVDSKTLTLNDLRLVKAFLTKVNDLSVSLKSFDPTKATKVTVKPVIGHILDIFDIVNGKIDPTIKINKNIDSMFQGIDILGGDQTESKLKDGVMLKAKPKRGLSVYVYKYTNGKWFVRGKDKQFTEPVVDEKIIKQLTDLAATGKNDAEQIQKDDEEKDKLKKADDEKAAAEKDTKDGIEKTKSAADATRASATPKKGKDIAKPGDKSIGFDKSKFEENFKSEYKNYF